MHSSLLPAHLCVLPEQLHALIEAHVNNVAAIRAHVRVLATAWVGHARRWPPPAAQRHARHSSSSTPPLSCAPCCRYGTCLLLLGGALTCVSPAEHHLECLRCIPNIQYNVFSKQFGAHQISASPRNRSSSASAGSSQVLPSMNTGSEAHSRGTICSN